MVLAAVEAGGGAAWAAAPTQPGSAAASAALVGVVMQTSNLSLTTEFGRANAAYVENEAQATSATLDLGALGALAANLPVCGNTLVKQSQLPQPLTADSEDGPRSTTTEGNLPGAGTESVSVAPDPVSASATTTPASFSIPGVVTVESKATSAVKYADGQEQDADAVTTADVSLLGGLVTLNGLRWDASDHDGASDKRSAAFSVGSVTIGPKGLGPTIPAGGAAQAIAAVNSVTKVLGITLVPPTESSNTQTGAESIGPLVLQFRGSALENQIVSPLGSAWVTLADALVKDFPDPGNVPCNSVQDLVGQSLPGITSLVNLVIGALEGGGGMQLDIGGATAGTQPAVLYTNPFQIGSPLGPTDTTLPLTVSPGTLATAGQAATTAPSAAASLGRRIAGAIRCVTTSPAGSPGCWNGMGVVAGVATAALAVGLLATDIAYGRRRRRRISTRRTL